MPSAARRLRALDKHQAPHLRLVPPPVHKPAPFLKWVGGKGKLLPALRPLMPHGKFRYAEPFLGGGAVFFDLKAEDRLEHALLCDLGRDLVGACKVVRDHLPALLARLHAHEANYLNENEENRALYFYAVRIGIRPILRWTTSSAPPACCS